MTDVCSGSCRRGCGRDMTCMKLCSANCWCETVGLPGGSLIVHTVRSVTAAGTTVYSNSVYERASDRVFIRVGLQTRCERARTRRCRCYRCLSLSRSAERGQPMRAERVGSRDPTALSPAALGFAALFGCPGPETRPGRR